MRKIGMSRAEMADMIERFVDGTCHQWEWDDFCAVEIVEPQLEILRMRCAGLSQEFPATQKGHYCSEAGMDVLRHMMKELRQSGEGTI